MPQFPKTAQKNLNLDIKNIFLIIREFTCRDFHVYSVQSDVYLSPQGKIFACGSITENSADKVREKGCVVRKPVRLKSGKKGV